MMGLDMRLFSPSVNIKYIKRLESIIRSLNSEFKKFDKDYLIVCLIEPNCGLISKQDSEECFDINERVYFKEYTNIQDDNGNDFNNVIVDKQKAYMTKQECIDGERNIPIENLDGSEVLPEDYKEPEIEFLQEHLNDIVY